MRSLLVSIVLVVSACSLMAQQADLSALRSATSEYPLGAPVTSPFSLLDVSRLNFSHSYSMTFFSGGNSSGSLGLLRSTMNYEFSPKLSLAVNIGVLHNSGAFFGSGEQDATVLPGLALDYHPSEKFRMSISIQQQSGLLSPYFYPQSRWRHPGKPY